MTATRPRAARGTARGRIVDAALRLVRERGLAATSVDDLCAAAGVTKGAFFHHFATKDDLAVAATRRWTDVTEAMFTAAAYHDAPSAAQRVLGYLDLRRDLIAGSAAEFSCVAGTMVQEAWTNEPIRDACGDVILGHAATLEDDLAEALHDAGDPPGVDAGGLARHIQAVLQGGFILAKAAGDPQVARDSVDHLRRYLTTLFTRAAGTP